ncbi:MAG: DUF3267 domain-containing protein [Bacteroidales bacterium]
MEDLHEYSRENLTINVVKANIFAILLLIPTSLLFGIPYYLIWGASTEHFGLNRGIKAESDIFETIPFIFILILGIILHELIHGITWARFAKDGFKSIRFGMMWKMITPYCHCKEPLTVKHYIIGGIAPIVLGIIPAIISIFIGSLDLLLTGIVFTIASSGDLMIINLLRKERSSDYVHDHPSEAGCYIYRRIQG